MVDGDARERELVNIFAQERLDSVPKQYHGIFDRGEWAVMRAPASGSATDRELPDVLVGNGSSFYAIEAKARERGQYVYLTEAEVGGLAYFAGNFGAQPRVAVRYNYNPWRFYDPESLYRTDGGNYRVREADLDDGLGITEL